MPKSKKTVQAPQAPVVPATPVVPAAPTPVDTAAPVATDDKKKAHLQRLQNQLNHNTSFMRMMGWTVGLIGAIMAIPYLQGIVEAFIWPIMKLPFWYFGMANWPFGGAGPLTNAVTSFIFGSQATSGIPMTFVKGLLPAFMAPAAVWVAFGVPLLLFAYQYAYVNWNENLFAPKPSAAALERDRKKDQPETKDAPELKQEPDNGKDNKQAPNNTALPPKTVVPPASTVNAAQRGNPILNGFKSKAQAAKEARERNRKVVKAAPKRAVTKKTALKKAAPRKAAPKKTLKRATKTPKAAPKKRARRRIN